MIESDNSNKENSAVSISSSRQDKLLACFECLLLTGEAHYDFFAIYISDLLFLQLPFFFTV